uniref:Signal recognition particle 9 kDa protein n=1 Tax=Panthera leo TaxID=9689 RepID=A0A8C8WRV9_PANLE
MGRGVGARRRRHLGPLGLRTGRWLPEVGGRWAGSRRLRSRASPPLALRCGPTMPQYQTWEEFSRAAEKLYLADPMKARVVLKYRHSDGSLCIKVTDDLVCLVYRTDQAQDVKKIEKFHSQLMRLMVAKESRSVAMETD